MLPSYLEKLKLDEIKQRVELLLQLQENCNLCPNNCSVNRLTGEYGICNSSDKIIISSAGAHFGEEPPLVGTNGSGTIFFTNCNLNCVFCQNYSISQLGEGYEISVEELARHMITLQNRGCHNINFVTPTHHTPQIVQALIPAIEAGLEIPLVYNCGGYESVDTLRLLENIFDIYMPDIKYSNNDIARYYSHIENYFTIASQALKEMHRQVGDLKLSKRGIAQRGLLIRHLVLPNNIAGSEKIIDFIVNNLSKDSYLNIMDQYHPAYKSGQYPEINRQITDIEFRNVIDYAIKAGLHRGFESGITE